MDYPTYASIIVGKTIKVELSDSDKEYFEEKDSLKKMSRTW